VTRAPQVINTCSLLFMALLTPAGQAFFHAHRRVRFERRDASAAVEAITFASVTGADRFTTRFACDTLRVLP
jgi:hypothetical protein